MAVATTVSPRTEEPGSRARARNDRVLRRDREGGVSNVAMDILISSRCGRAWESRTTFEILLMYF